MTRESYRERARESRAKGKREREGCRERERASEIEKGREREREMGIEKSAVLYHCISDYCSILSLLMFAAMPPSKASDF